MSDIRHFKDMIIGMCNYLNAKQERYFGKDMLMYMQAVLYSEMHIPGIVWLLSKAKKSCGFFTELLTSAVIVVGPRSQTCFWL